MRSNGKKVRSGTQRPAGKPGGNPSTRNGSDAAPADRVIEERNARVRQAAQRAKKYAAGKVLGRTTG